MSRILIVGIVGVFAPHVSADQVVMGGGLTVSPAIRPVPEQPVRPPLGGSKMALPRKPPFAPRSVEKRSLRGRKRRRKRR